jgi:hypothetical protein
MADTDKPGPFIPHPRAEDTTMADKPAGMLAPEDLAKIMNELWPKRPGPPDLAEFLGSVAAAMISAPPLEKRRLAWAYPRIADFLRDNGYPDMPRERPEKGDQGPNTPLCGADYDDLEGQLQCAMGDDIHPAWAPAVIEIIRHRHPDLWENAVAAARNADTNRTEM